MKERGKVASKWSYSAQGTGSHLTPDHTVNINTKALGRSDLQFWIRVRGHLDESLLIEPHYSSALDEFIAETQHHSSVNNVLFLHFKDGWKKRLAVENMKIHRHLANKFVIVNRIQPDHDNCSYFQWVNYASIYVMSSVFIYSLLYLSFFLTSSVVFTICLMMLFWPKALALFCNMQYSLNT